MKKGYAIGVAEIKSDCITFFYKGEEFSVPSSRLLKYPQLAHYNGSHYEAKIKDVKAALER